MKTTLQVRLITLMVLSSIFLISTFTIIQLNNQLQRVAEFNIYRAKQGALITKEKLEQVFSPIGALESPLSIITKVDVVFASLLQSHTIETATLLDKEAKPVASEGEIQPALVSDKAVLEKISQISDKSRWLFPLVDKKHRLINLFVTLKDSHGYVVKLTYSLGNLQQALNEVYVPVVLAVTIVVIGNIILATLLSRVLISPVKLLNQATKDIADLDKRVSIKTKDELEELANTFNYMTVELKKMKARAENVNPLTKLPGNIVIREKVEKRIKNGDKFVLIYCDLDNFKAFNDKYGIHAGDEAIMLTAEIFKEALAKAVRPDDFIGHEGGDDFLFLTTPEQVVQTGAYITKEFDKRIRSFYSKEDLERGYIEARARDSEEIKKFPVMTISLAGVSNIKQEINSYAQVTNIAADVKKAAKKTKGSKLLIDRRTTDLGKDFRGKGDTADSHQE